MPVESSKRKRHEEPLFIDLLNENDKRRYNELREQFSSSQFKNRRNKSNNVFKNMIHLIKTFVDTDQEDTSKRSLVCGIVWIHDMIIINTHQLRILIDKCKSSINGSFQSIGYEALPSGEEYINHIITLYPFMKNNYSELRQWTARKLVKKEMKSKQKRNIILLKKDIPLIDRHQPQNIISNQVKAEENKINLNNFNRCNDISPAPDLSDIINNCSENHLFSFEKENDIMSQYDDFQIMRNDSEKNMFNDDFLQFIPKFPSHIDNEIGEIKEYQNHFEFNDLNEKLYM